MCFFGLRAIDISARQAGSGSIPKRTSRRCRSRSRERAASADRASEPAHTLSETIRDGSSVRRQTKGNDLRCHDHPSARDG